MRIHLIAVGGSAMHNLAIALKLAGHDVTGSDDEIFEPALSRLQQYGLLPAHIGWDAAHITPDMDCVIAGMHAKGDNPELVKALALGLRVQSYPEFIYAETKQKQRIVIGGSHGKTTTTAMIMHALQYAGKPYDYLVGAQLPGFDVMIRLTPDVPCIILEGDEYPDSAINKTPKFLVYKADVAVITGIAWDHVNIFPTFELYIGAFKTFVSQLPDNAPLIFNNTDAHVREVALQEKNRLNLLPYSLPEYTTTDGQTYITYAGKKYAVGVFGQHNLLNMMAALEISKLQGVGEEQFFKAMQTFTGASKRLEKLAESPNCVVYRDFAHAPSKVEATVNAVREMYPDRRIIACLEIHTYSSLTPAFLPEYRNTLQHADIRCVCYSPHALEIKKLPPVSIQQVKDAFADSDLHVFDNKQQFEAFLKAQDYNDSVLLLMSSGNYDGIDMAQLAKRVIA